MASLWSKLSPRHDVTKYVSIQETSKAADSPHGRLLGGNLPRGNQSADDESLAIPFSSRRHYLLLGSLLANFCAAIFLAGIAIWSLRTFPKTSLHDEILTPDGKSFPWGTLGWSQTFAPTPCGTTPAKAKSRDCHFDLISTSWLPPKCIDDELVHEFQSVFPWTYYADPGANETWPSDPDTLGAVGGKIWTTERWHTAHCLFMWKKLSRALVQGRTTDA